MEKSTCWFRNTPTSYGLQSDIWAATFPCFKVSDALLDTFGTSRSDKNNKNLLYSLVILIRKFSHLVPFPERGGKRKRRGDGQTEASRRRVSPEEHFLRQFIYFGEIKHLPVCSSHKFSSQFYWLVSATVSLFVLCVFFCSMLPILSFGQVLQTAVLLLGLWGD